MYFIFVANTGMFQQVIVPLPRVRSIFFDTPVRLDPLSALEAKAVIDRRYELLAAPGKQWIKPVSDQVVESLYHIFAGRIRYVMNAITSLISHLPDSYARSLELAQATTMFQAIVLERSEGPAARNGGGGAPPGRGRRALYQQRTGNSGAKKQTADPKILEQLAGLESSFP